MATRSAPRPKLSELAARGSVEHLKEQARRIWDGAY